MAKEVIVFTILELITESLTAVTLEVGYLESSC